MANRPKPRPCSAVAAHRRRLKSQGLRRLELQARAEDAPLLRAVAAALADPDRAPEARAVLRDRFGQAAGTSLKALLEAAPLDGVALDRARGTWRPVEP